MSAHMFPLKLIRADPSSLGTADCDYIGRAEDGLDYAVKTVTKNPATPAAEWFCYKLAAFCNIATPQCAQILMPDSSLAFGSTWDGGVVNDFVIKQHIIDGTLSAGLLADRLSAIFALDLFVYNPDRHFDNYLFIHGRAEYAVKAFDFSQAWTANGWPLPGLLLPTACNTMNTYKALVVRQPFDLAAAKSVLAKLRTIPVTSIASILGEMPPAWMAAQFRADISKWWDSVDRTTRIDGILQELEHGRVI